MGEFLNEIFFMSVKLFLLPVFILMAVCVVQASAAETF